MRTMKVKRAIIFLLAIGLMVVVTGCARWPDGPNGNGGTENYQLQITVEVKGVINTSEGIYYIVMDADGNSATGPGYDISFWDDRFYYIKLEDGFFYFAQKEEGSSEISLTSSSIGENKFQVTIALSDLGVPSDIDFSIDINVITTDSENNTYDHLDSYFTISTIINSTGEGIVSGDGTGGENFDIVKIEALITTLY